MKDNLFANMLLRYVVNNSYTLSDLAQTMGGEDKGKDYSFTLSDEALYSRLLSGINFSKLSDEQKNEFLFLASDKLNNINKESAYNSFMPLFLQEAHNRTCKNLGVKPTIVNFIDFSKDERLDGEEWAIFSEGDGNIYLNSSKNYSICRPSMLLENLNMVTREYSIYRNIFNALTNPEKLSKKDYFLSLTTAVKTFVYDNLKVNDPQFFKQLLAVDYTSPIGLEKTIFSFERTRKDFQKAGLYGSMLRDKLRHDEEVYHEYLSDEGVSDSLVNLEDIFQSFRSFLIVQKVDSPFIKIFEALEKEYFSDYYNSLGANATLGQGVREYLDMLEEEMFDKAGITMEEYLKYKNGEENNQDSIDYDDYGEGETVSDRIIDEGYGDDEVPGYVDGVSEDEFDSYDFGEGEDEEDIAYRRMDSVISPEGRIIDGLKLPFGCGAEQDGGMSL